MEINNIYHGFKLIDVRRVSDIDSTIYEFKHLKSGANLVYLACEDTNKCFSVGFKTLPQDSTGVCHIIEHSLLCGSKKYPVKEPFVNLLKGSMATFLNAMTASDFTIYPVASQNDKDFDNLMKVYLDAVFAPLCMSDDKPFLQEGWHYHLENKDDELKYNGIVYNEMKGAMSGVEGQLGDKLESVLYKGSCYEYNSGGDPLCIPSLTYEDYKAFYHKHYHPSNGLIYFYGKLDILEKLAYIDETYLSLFENSDDNIQITMPIERVSINNVSEYAITEDEEVENNTYMAVAFALDKITNINDIRAFKILDSALMASNASPLKKALLDRKLGVDVISSVETYNIKPSYQFGLYKTNLNTSNLFIDAIFEEFEKITVEGIDEELLLATINRMEFSYKEMDTGTSPKGINFNFSVLQSFLYELPYEAFLEYSESCKFFKENIKTGYFENLIKKYILSSKHYASVVLVPSKELEAKQEKEMHEKMAQIKSNLTNEEIDYLVKKTHELRAYQSKIDDYEDVIKLPNLKLKDISTSCEQLPTELENKNGYQLIKHNFNTNKIGYAIYSFNMNVLSLDEIPYLSILTRLYRKLNTKNYTAVEIQNYINKYLGSLSFSNSVLSIDKDNIFGKTTIVCSALDSNVSYMSHMINELINNTIFDEENVKMVLIQMQSNFKNSISENSVDIAIGALRSTLCKEGVVAAKLRGLDFYEFICDLLNNFDFDALKEKLINISHRLFNRNNMIASISGDEEVLALLEEEIYKLELSDEEVTNNLCIHTKDNIGDALVIASGVSSNAMGINLKDLNIEMNGTMHIILHILNYDYLWPLVRVKGGAYGCYVSVANSGDLTIASYCDPNVSNTYQVYENIANYLENLEATEEEFLTYQIGTMAKFDQPVSNSVKIVKEDNRIFSKITLEDRIKIKKEILNTTLEDVKGYAKVFRQLAQLGKIFTVGNETKIKEYNRLADIKKLK